MPLLQLEIIYYMIADMNWKLILFLSKTPIRFAKKTAKNITIRCWRHLLPRYWEIVSSVIALYIDDDLCVNYGSRCVGRILAVSQNVNNPNHQTTYDRICLNLICYIL